MAKAKPPPAVKLICGMISSQPEFFEPAQAAAAAVLGPTDIVSDVMNFDFTNYYDQEMGSPLYRRFWSFADLVAPDALAAAKIATNALEDQFAARAPQGPPRPVNLDPGYVESAKLVLASMKNFSHRIYLRDGVYAEVTLLYRAGGWEKLPWTFPDFASGRYMPFLDRVRTRLREQLGQESAS